MPDNHKEKRRVLFLKAVESLNLENANSEISKKTGYNSGNLSKIMSGTNPPSTSFIQLFEEAYNLKIEDFDFKEEKEENKECEDVNIINYQPNTLRKTLLKL